MALRKPTAANRTRTTAIVASAVFVGAVMLGPAATVSSAAAAAGVVEVSGGTLRYIAAEGLRNDVDVTGGPSRYEATTALVVSDRAGLRAGTGCSQVTPTEVRCSAKGVSSVLLDGGDRFDSLGSETY